MKPFTITRDNYGRIIDEWNNRGNKANRAELDIYLEFNLCPLPIFDAKSLYLFELYGLLGGLGNVDYFKLQLYPEVYIEAVKLLNGEINWAYKYYTPKENHG